LTRIKGREDLTYEVTACKDRLEQIIGAEVPMFCYPNGRYDYRVIEELKRAGYKGARTTRMLSVTSTFNPFEIPTSLQVFPHLKSGYVRGLGRAKNILGIWRFTTQLSGFPSWIALGKELFDQALQKGGIWHLYGHSWEIEQLALWKELEEMLDYVANRDGVIYASNAQMLSTVTCAASF
jgi:peptidoglycan/xylan/chitin deacetylase (PgdA/CDA1 family)